MKTRADGLNNVTYKKYVRKFEEGSVQEWIDLLKDLEEIWTQNSIHGGTDRVATIHVLIWGETLTSFKAALVDPQECDTNENKNPGPILMEQIDSALAAVSTIVFPHRALENQKVWMTRGMRKPYDMFTRRLSAVVSKMNNALPLFPGGSEESKFSEKELIQILEYAVPPKWKGKFNWDRYVPTNHSKVRFIEECEGIECHIKNKGSLEDFLSPKRKKYLQDEGKRKRGRKGP